ncbi:MAG: hypothetical protein HQK99_14245 [Nitrospirae bacterium]|nr:hypothetical protein [Nitrospirota bacterium]
MLNHNSEQILSCCDSAVIMDDVVEAYGWAIARDGVRSVEVFSDSKLIAGGSYGGARMDVHKVYPDYPDSIDCGYYVSALLDKKLSDDANIILRITTKTSQTMDIPLKHNKELRYRPCHFHEMFIHSDGHIHPCCVTLRDDLIIGHINDVDIIEKIDAFHARCSCDSFTLRRASRDDKKRYFFINIEMSLLCNAKCAQCSVDAPSWHAKYDLYSSLTRIIEQLRPMTIAVQGGELLIQKKSLDWTAQIGRRYPDMDIMLLTNGCADMGIVPFVNETFDRVVISIYGFQPETYKKTTGLELSKTLSFAEELIRHGKCKVNLKYLTTPINLHEVNLFLRWALWLLPERIILADSNIAQYINTGTPDRFWEKIEERTKQSVQDELRNARAALKDSGCTIVIDSVNRKRLGIEELTGDEVLGKHITSPAKSRTALLGRGTGLM